MKKLSNKYSFLLCLLLVACAEPSTKMVRSGSPENLMDTSLETTKVSLGKKNSVSTLSKTLAEYRPSSAELRCSIANTRCAQAKEILERNTIPFSVSGEKSNDVVLSYKKVTVHDCSTQYIDDMGGSSVEARPYFGCAIASNVVQMVSNKRQFTEPNLMDFPDAEKAAQSYSEYQKLSSKREEKDVRWNNQTGVSR